MRSVLLTAFEPYGAFAANASWLCLQDLTRELPAAVKLTTRRYPVDFAAARERLRTDLAANHDFAIHLGQAPGSGGVRLEAAALNVGGLPEQPPESFAPLDPSGPAAYLTDLPLAAWSAALREAGVPAQVSHHAGTYLCNAIYYWSRRFSQTLSLKTRSLFIHLPLDTSQALDPRTIPPSLPAATSAAAVRLILNKLAAL